MLKLRSVCLCLSVLSLTAVSSWAQNLPAPSLKDEVQFKAPLNAQERLEAIRHSLVEASLQTPTKVLSTSWLDNNGSLRETSSFKNGMQVIQAERLAASPSYNTNLPVVAGAMAIENHSANADMMNPFAKPRHSAH